MPLKLIKRCRREAASAFLPCGRKISAPGCPINDDRPQGRSGSRPVFGASPSFSESRSRSPRAFDCSMTGAAARNCTTGEFNTHKTDVSVVRYPWHPWFGRQVTIRWIHRRAGITILGCTADDESDRPVLEIPQWMCESGACTGMCVETSARVDCGTLRTLKTLLERVVRFQQESALEVQHHSTFGGADAQKNNCDTYPVRSIPTTTTGAELTIGNPPESDSASGPTPASTRENLQPSPRRRGKP
jgi:hypothetical protein